jgi:tRNA nucleotidyltransferase/poly(A) polymerase
VSILLPDPPPCYHRPRLPVLDPDLIDSDADRVVRKLARAGFKAYLVGGCVRDLLVGKTPKDFDVATSATPNEVRNTFRNCRIIGRRFRLAHVFFGDKIIETSTFRANPRDDDEDEGELLIRRDNVFGTETEDARRRDFTINGLFYDVEKQQVIDHVDGLADLNAGLIRTIGDPDIRFQEDPIRMLRALKFAARLGFSFETRTFEALLRWRGEISKCAPPRVLEEIYRVLRGGAARRSFELLVETDVLAVMSPQLAALVQGSGAAVKPTEFSVTPSLVRSKVKRSENEFGEAVNETDEDAESQSAFGFQDPGDMFPDQHVDLPDLAPTGSLDDEERAWHRVWADAPRTASVSKPRNLRLSFMRDADAVTTARRNLWNTLPLIDTALAAGNDVPSMVALGTMINSFLLDQGERQSNDFNSAIHELVHPLLTELRITRRDGERLRYLLMAQRKLALAAKREQKPQLFGSNDLVNEAVMLFALTSQGAGRVVPPIALTVTRKNARDEDNDSSDDNGSDDEQSDDGDVDVPGQPRKKRRRRRGGRFR